MIKKDKGDFRRMFKVLKIPREHTQQVIKALNSFKAETGIPPHFKRVRGDVNNFNEILLNLASNHDSNPSNSVQTKIMDFLLKTKIFNFRITEKELPINKPEEKEEYMELSKEWPMTFSQRKRPELTEEEKDLYKELIEKEGLLDKEEATNICLILEPGKKEPLIKAKSKNEKESPLNHSVKLAIDDYCLKYLMTDLGRYLLSGLTVIVKNEPCMMCAMAMVHSRIKRVIFLSNNKTFLGALNNKLNIIKLKVNHKYEVFQFDSNSKTFINLN